MRGRIFGTGRLLILMLAAGTFAVGVDAVIISGLLPGISSSLDVSSGAAGQLVTVFALGYAILAPLLAAPASRYPPRLVLGTALAVFAAANLVAALAPDYGVLAAARVLASAGAALYTPAAISVASTYSAPARRGRTLSVVLSGASVAAVLGVPAGLYLSAALSWHAAFGVIAGIAAATGAVVAKRAPARAEPRSGLRPWSQLTMALVDGGVRRLLATTLLAYLGEFVVYSYLGFALVEVSRTPDRALPAAYLIFGVAGVAGNLLAGRASDRLPAGRVAAGGLLVLAASLIAFPLLLPHPAVVPVALCGCGAGAWIVSVPQQQRLLIASPSAAQTVLGLNQAALYLGISGAAILGAVLIPVIGVGRLGFVGAVLELAALGVSCTI